MAWNCHKWLSILKPEQQWKSLYCDMWQLSWFENPLILFYRVKVQVKEVVLMTVVWVVKIPKCRANWNMTSSLQRSHKKCLKPRDVCWMRASLQHLYVLDLNVGQQLYVVRLKYEVITLSELFVATSFLPFYCINVAHSADNTSVDQNGSGRW